MAKNCFKCLLAITAEQKFLCCLLCNNVVHSFCCHEPNQAEHEDLSKKWLCPSCKTETGGSITLYINKINELLLKMKLLQDEQNGIINSLLNNCTDAMGEYEESIKVLTTMVNSLQLQFNSCNDQQNDASNKSTICENDQSSTS